MTPTPTQKVGAIVPTFAAATTDTPEAIIIDATRAGVLLIADQTPATSEARTSGHTCGGTSGGGGLRFKALHTMPAQLAQRIRDRRADVLALLRCTTEHNAPTPTPPTTSTRDDLPPLAREALAVFPEAEVVRIKASHTTSANPYRITCTANPQRQPVVDLLADVFDTDPKQAADLRDAWHERIAICTADDGMTTPDAEAVALAELQQHTAPPRITPHTCASTRSALR